MTDKLTFADDDAFEAVYSDFINYVTGVSKITNTSLNFGGYKSYLVNMLTLLDAYTYSDAQRESMEAVAGTQWGYANIGMSDTVNFVDMDSFKQSVVDYCLTGMRDYYLSNPSKATSTYLDFIPAVEDIEPGVDYTQTLIFDSLKTILKFICGSSATDVVKYLDFLSEQWLTDVTNQTTIEELRQDVLDYVSTIYMAWMVDNAVDLETANIAATDDTTDTTDTADDTTTDDTTDTTDTADDTTTDDTTDTTDTADDTTTDETSTALPAADNDIVSEVLSCIALISSSDPRVDQSTFVTTLSCMLDKLTSYTFNDSYLVYLQGWIQYTWDTDFGGLDMSTAQTIGTLKQGITSYLLGRYASFNIIDIGEIGDTNEIALSPVRSNSFIIRLRYIFRVMDASMTDSDSGYSVDTDALMTYLEGYSDKYNSIAETKLSIVMTNEDIADVWSGISSYLIDGGLEYTSDLYTELFSYFAAAFRNQKIYSYNGYMTTIWGTDYFYTFSEGFNGIISNYYHDLYGEANSTMVSFGEEMGYDMQLLITPNPETGETQIGALLVRGGIDCLAYLASRSSDIGDDYNAVRELTISTFNSYLQNFYNFDNTDPSILFPDSFTTNMTDSFGAFALPLTSLTLENFETMVASAEETVDDISVDTSTYTSIVDTDTNTLDDYLSAVDTIMTSLSSNTSDEQESFRASMLSQINTLYSRSLDDLLSLKLNRAAYKVDTDVLSVAPMQMGLENLLMNLYETDSDEYNVLWPIFMDFFSSSMDLNGMMTNNVSGYNMLQIFVSLCNLANPFLDSDTFDTFAAALATLFVTSYEAAGSTVSDDESEYITRLVNGTMITIDTLDTSSALESQFTAMDKVSVLHDALASIDSGAVSISDDFEPSTTDTDYVALVSCVNSIAPSKNPTSSDLIDATACILGILDNAFETDALWSSSMQLKFQAALLASWGNDVTSLDYTKVLTYDTLLQDILEYIFNQYFKLNTYDKSPIGQVEDVTLSASTSTAFLTGAAAASSVTVDALIADVGSDDSSLLMTNYYIANLWKSLSSSLIADDSYPYTSAYQDILTTYIAYAKVWKDINYSNYMSTIFTSDEISGDSGLIPSLTTLISGFDEDLASTIESALTTNFDSAGLTDDGIRGQYIVNAGNMLLDQYEFTDSQTQSIVDLFNDLLASYEDVDSYSDYMDFPDAFDTALTSGFGIFELPLKNMMSSTFDGFITEAESDLSITIDSSTYSDLMGDQTVYTINDFLGVVDTIAASLDSGDVQSFKENMRGQIADAYTENLYGTLLNVTTLDLLNDFTTTLSEYADNISYQTNILSYLLTSNNMSTSSMTGYNYLQILTELIEYTSATLDQSDLDTLANVSAENFVTLFGATEETEVADEENDDVSLLMKGVSAVINSVSVTADVTDSMSNTFADMNKPEALHAALVGLDFSDLIVDYKFQDLIDCASEFTLEGQTSDELLETMGCCLDILQGYEFTSDQLEEVQDILYTTLGIDAPSYSESTIQGMQKQVIDAALSNIVATPSADSPILATDIPLGSKKSKVFVETLISMFTKDSTGLSDVSGILAILYTAFTPYIDLDTLTSDDSFPAGLTDTQLTDLWTSLSAELTSGSDEYTYLEAAYSAYQKVSQDINFNIAMTIITADDVVTGLTGLLASKIADYDSDLDSDTVSSNCTSIFAAAGSAGSGMSGQAFAIAWMNCLEYYVDNLTTTEYTDEQNNLYVYLSEYYENELSVEDTSSLDLLFYPDSYTDDVTTIMTPGFGIYGMNEPLELTYTMLTLLGTSQFFGNAAYGLTDDQKVTVSTTLSTLGSSASEVSGLAISSIVITIESMIESFDLSNDISDALLTAVLGFILGVYSANINPLLSATVSYYDIIQPWRMGFISQLSKYGIDSTTQELVFDLLDSILATNEMSTNGVSGINFMMIGFELLDFLSSINDATSAGFDMETLSKDLSNFLGAFPQAAIVSIGDSPSVDIAAIASIGLIAGGLEAMISGGYSAGTVFGSTSTGYSVVEAITKDTSILAL